MPEHDALILSFSHLPDFPRAPDALQTLKKVASLVKPIMRVRGWKVRELAEFYPDQANLLGLNINRGQRILVRLRYPNDRSLFLPIEHVVDTMLHELSHIVFGPHDGNFHALWNQLRDEHESLIRKGYTGEGFLSDGHRLGGGRIPMHEARRLARASAEKRRTLTKGSGQRLGGSGPSIGSDIRRTIVGAIERRNTTLQGCGNTNHNDREIQQISETATKNGFRTQAEEDAANEAAIAQALWELVQEEERQRYGGYFIPPTAQNPTGNGGGSVMGDNENRSSSVPPPIPGPGTRPPSVPRLPRPETRPPVVSAPVPQPAPQRGWTCGVCTLHNPSSFLCCDACGTERGQDPQRQVWTPNAEKRERERERQRASMAATAKSTTQPATIDLTSSPPRASSSKKPGSSNQRPEPVKPLTWQCSYCGTMMERQWWTCSTCGVMKDNSI
ncbi:WLM domain-containing protein [Colletotrichum scovillei]|uniref:WLM domain-containing protein n=1 Tax=Colletotrichum scovillei TaxID=1209932 RepID=UPI0015C2DD25|nr:WLM domain-containing protein [Colletotrichum scovillei]KAF4784379.1 WLM domain-containing protein [Colletotrichum scovillei]KAG7064384.1 WLM domain-containing protein [Colletotrichum scovillei]